MKDLIPFNEWSRDKIDHNGKCCTSRHRRYPNDPRVTWISPKLPWVFIREFLWRQEGAASPRELQEVIEDIYKREVPDDEMFYVHFFGDETPFKERGSKEKEVKKKLKVKSISAVGVA